MALRTHPTIAAVLILAACASAVPLTRSETDVGIRSVPIEAGRLSLGPVGADLAGGVRFAGGLSLRGPDVLGLSDLKQVGGRLVTVSDMGHRLDFAPVLDTRGRLIGVRNATVRALTDVDGVALSPKPHADADAEGLALIDDDRILVSFERDHRIWSYGPEGSARPVAVPHPDASFGPNAGMEGLAAAGRDGWLVLGEAGGAWTCDDGGCTSLPGFVEPSDDGYSMTGADRDPAGGWFVVERFFAPPFDMRARVRRMDASGRLGPVLIALRLPATVDNFEGIAAVRTPGVTRLYLLSDDNANPLQRTLLLAFDVAAAGD